MSGMPLASRPLRLLSRRPSIGQWPQTSVPSQPSQFPSFQRRHESTRKRLIQRLRLPPAPSFKATTLETQDHIIFNPPSSSPNVYHTPLIFLPKNDPRRTALMSATSKAVASSSKSTPGLTQTASPTTLPPALHGAPQRKDHLTQADVEEMRTLRQKDPRTWTQKALSEKFGCSRNFVSLVCQSAVMKAEHTKRMEEVMSKWGRRRREAREDRQKRRELWGQEA